VCDCVTTQSAAIHCQRSSDINRITWNSWYHITYSDSGTTQIATDGLGQLSFALHRSSINGNYTAGLQWWHSVEQMSYRQSCYWAITRGFETKINTLMSSSGLKIKTLTAGSRDQDQDLGTMSQNQDQDLNVWSQDQDRDLVGWVLRPRPRPWHHVSKTRPRP